MITSSKHISLLGMSLVGSLLTAAAMVNCGSDDAKPAEAGGGAAGQAVGGSGGAGGANRGGAGGNTVSSAGAGGAKASNDDAPTDAQCESYCQKITTKCQDTRQYSTVGAASDKTEDEIAAMKNNCMSYCRLALNAGSAQDTDKDTLGCRMNALAKISGDQAAAQEVEYCFDAGPTGGEQCGKNTCQVFCSASDLLCPGSYPSKEVCEQECKEFNKLSGGTEITSLNYNLGDFSKGANASNSVLDKKDDLLCRFYYLTLSGIKNYCSAIVPAAQQAKEGDVARCSTPRLV